MTGVRKAQVADIGPLAVTLARAFEDDPVQVWILPDDATRVATLTGMFEATLRELYLPLAESYTVTDRAAGALWMPPNQWEIDDEAMARLAPVAEILGDRLGALMTMLELGAEHHPHEPGHYYLNVVGTDPSRQGQGLGSAAMRLVLERCDAEGLGAYLESSKETNVAFYEHHGFVVTETMQLPDDGPSLWCMWREPRG